MSVANLGHSAGSKIYGMVAEQTSYSDAYMLMSVLVVVMIIILVFHRHKGGTSAKTASKARKSYTIGTGGGGAGMFFSGAIRCPKCEADMEQLEIEDTYIDHYPCPRCGGAMDKKVDPQQRHIWYETCVDCNGSFFDAGEFLDLSQLTISDVFKRLVTPKRI